MKKNQNLNDGVAQTERIGLGDLVIVLVLAGLTWFFARHWEFPFLNPGVWEEATVASFVRPAQNVVPGYFTCVASVIYKIFGLQAGATMLRLLGHVMLAMLAVCVYAVLREWLAFAMRARPQLSRRRTLVMRLASALGALAFVVADPVWSAGQCLTETTILIGLTLATFEFFFVFLRKGTIKYAYLCALCVGLLAAETPMGLMLALVLILINRFILTRMPAMESPFFDPSVMEVGKWHLTFIFLASIGLGVAVNSYSFIIHHGPEAIGCSAGDVPLRYLLDYWHRVSAACGTVSWVLWAGVFVMPFVVATIKFPSSADEEQFLSYSSGIIFFMCGVVALSQFSFLPALWFWTHAPVESQYLLSVGLFCGAATLAQALTILGVDSLCRDHKRLAKQVFGVIPMVGEEVDDDDDDEDEDDAASIAARRRAKAFALRSARVIRVSLIVVISLVMVAVMLPGRVKSTTREMMSIIREAIAEIVDEGGDAKYLITDGNLDAAIELEAVRRGLPLKCYSLINDNTPRSSFLRLRNMKDEEDRQSFGIDTAMGVRCWLRDKPERLAEAAALMGFDLWKRDGKGLPTMRGLLARLSDDVTAGQLTDDEKAARVQEVGRDVARAHALAERVLAVYARPGGLRDCTDEKIRFAFETVQWRLARMCLYRDEAASLNRDLKSAEIEKSLCTRLNDTNGLYKRLMSMAERQERQRLQKLTMREGLQLALVRADFALGKYYAETVLGVDPQNPDANFAMGMYYQSKGELLRAETYLTRCLIRRPNEPAYYNNLAMLQIEMGRFDAARANVEKALKLIPESAAVRDTQLKLEEAVKAAKAPKAQKK